MAIVLFIAGGLIAGYSILLWNTASMITHQGVAAMIGIIGAVLISGGVVASSVDMARKEILKAIRKPENSSETGPSGELL